jgi:hypothetical protein
VSPTSVTQRLLGQGAVVVACAAVVVAWALGLVHLGEGRLGQLPLMAGVVGAVTLFQLARTAQRLRSEEGRAAVTAPIVPADREPSPRTALDEQSSFVLRQKLTPFQNRYELRGEDDALIAFVAQKRLALKERIDAWRTEDRAAVLFSIQALTIIDLGGRYLVDDEDSRVIGGLEKVFGKSLLRSSWLVHDSAGAVVAGAQERSLPVALWRRFNSFIPFVGGVLDLIPVRFHFDLLAPDGSSLGALTRRFGFRDHYDLVLDDPERVLDRRLALALAVALDALQSR